MKRKIPLNSTFQEIRQLPIDIPFSKVEEWVTQYTFPKESWTKRLLLKYWFKNNSN